MVAAMCEGRDDLIAPRKMRGPTHDKSVKCNTETRETMATRLPAGMESNFSFVSHLIGISKISFQDGLNGLPLFRTSWNCNAGVVDSCK